MSKKITVAAKATIKAAILWEHAGMTAYAAAAVMAIGYGTARGASADMIRALEEGGVKSHAAKRLSERSVRLIKDHADVAQAITGAMGQKAKVAAVAAFFSEHKLDTEEGLRLFLYPDQKPAGQPEAAPEASAPKGKGKGKGKARQPLATADSVAITAEGVMGAVRLLEGSELASFLVAFDAWRLAAVASSEASKAKRQTKRIGLRKAPRVAAVA